MPTVQHLSPRWKTSVWVELSYIRCPIAKEASKEASAVRETFSGGSKVEVCPTPRYDSYIIHYFMGLFVVGSKEVGPLAFQSL